MFDFDYWGGYIDDMWPEELQELTTAVESGKPFDTDWHYFYNDSAAMRVRRDGNITVSCAVFSDEPYLEAAKDKTLPDADIREILNAAKALLEDCRNELERLINERSK